MTSVENGAPEPAWPGLGPGDFEKLFRLAPSATVLVDHRGVILAVNDEAEELFGYPRLELVGQPVELLLPIEVAEAHRNHRAAYARSPEKRPMGIGRELFARTKDGREVPVEIGLSPIETERGTLTLASIHDITDRKRLRAFSTGVLQGAEEERQRIARELHDETAQSLSALALRLQMARRAADPVRKEELLGGMYDEIRRASEGVHRVLRGLRPPALEEAGLVSAVRAMVRDSLTETGLDIHLECGDIESSLAPDARLALYRIIQEAVSNVIRHANATRVWIELIDGGEEVCATVRDNGCGFSVRDRTQIGGRGLGMLGMQERAAIVGGRVRIQSEPMQGTTIYAAIPTGLSTRPPEEDI